MPEILTQNIESPKLVIDFLKAYRPDLPNGSNVPTACLLKGKKEKKISDLIDLEVNEEVYVYWDKNEEIRKENLKNIELFWIGREPWEDYDFCVFPENLSWAIGCTHNDYCIITTKQEVEPIAAGQCR